MYLKEQESIFTDSKWFNDKFTFQELVIYIPSISVSKLTRFLVENPPLKNF